MTSWPQLRFREFLQPNQRPFTLGADQDADLVGMRLYGFGPFHREHKVAMQIAKKTHFVIRAGDVVYNKLFAWKGTFGIVPSALDGMYVSDKFPTYELDRTRVDERFLALYFRYPPLWGQAQSMSTGSAALSKLTLNPPKFLELIMAVPPVAEQRRIVARIEAIAGRIEEARRLRGEAETESAVLFQKRLAAQMEESGGSWTRATVADVIKSMESGWSPQCGDVPAKPDGWGVLKTTAIQWCEFRSAENKELPPSLAPRPDLAVKCGDVLVTRAGPMKRVGIPAAVMTDHPRLMISDKIIRLRPRLDTISARFLELALAAPLAQDHLLHRKTGLADAQVNISQQILRATPLSYPPLPMQAEIVTSLEALQARVSALGEHQSDASELIEALLPACLDMAFRGEM